MKKTIKTIIAMTLLLIMATISPMTDLSVRGGGNALDSAVFGGPGTVKAAEKTADGSGNLYISDIRIGNAYTSDGPDVKTVARELEADGYTVLMNGGEYADLNKGAGSKSALKEGPNDKIILLGYKTTTDPKEAITDLAVMNMNGGYDVEAYENLIKTQLDTQIKPLVDRFLSTINEYRENLKKPKDTTNFRRADFVRKALNKLTDDDTGGKPLGDLLINKTKYELGDDKYNSLSAGEKTEHADILTILLQGNPRAILLMENLLSKAADTSDDTWIERMKSESIDSLVEEIQAEKPGLSTKKDVYDELDKRYYDIAKDLLDKWSVFQEALGDNDKTLEELDKAEDDTTLEDASEKIEELGEEGDKEKLSQAATEAVEGFYETEIQTMNLQNAAAYEFLEGIAYQDGTMLDFFERDADELFAGDEIRQLYPMAASLSEGQIAGLEFLSIRDLVSAAMFDEADFSDETLKDLPQASVFEDVDRGIYEKGGVGLTSEAIRAKAALADADEVNYSPSTLTWVYIGLTTAITVATVAMAAVKLVIRTYLKNTLLPTIKGLAKTMGEITTDSVIFAETQAKVNDLIAKARTMKGIYDTISKQLLQGFTIAIAIMMVATTAIFLMDYARSYDVTFKSIPKYMVDEADITAYNKRGEKIVVKNQTAYYKAVLCNRIKGKSDVEKKNYEKLLDRADLNGDIGKQWLALYAAKNTNDTPILADSLLYRIDDNNLPVGYETGIHEFGGRAAANLNKKGYLFAEEPPAIYVYYKKETASFTNTSADVKGDKDSDNDSGADSDSDAASGRAGSIFFNGSESGSGITPAGVALGGGIGIILGGLLGALIMYFSRKKKVSVEKDEEKN